MALIKCSECGREISDKAETCPACGSPLQDKKIQKPVVIEQTSKSWKVIQLISGILIIVGLFMVFGNAASRGSADLAAKQMGNFFAGLG
ncbi:MAG: zinc ribbon domain-containing protein, partial [Minisyncoccales bacterium]